MYRTLIALSLLASTASADDTVLVSSGEARARDQGLGAEVGVAAGGGVTPGGMRISGHYLYQLSAQDWFDGTASLTYGGGDAACYMDRASATVCDHDLAAGSGIEIAATVRRMFRARGAFTPFARAGIGVAYVRFPADDVSGLAFPLHAGAGMRTRIAPHVALVAQAELALGIGAFSRDLGAEAQLGMAVTAGAEFDLR